MLIEFAPKMAAPGKWLGDTSPEMPISDVARAAVVNRLETLWHYLPLAADRPEEDIEHIHQLRVATRRSSAALRIFRTLLPNRSGKWIGQELKRVRQAAGDARDLDVFIERIENQQGHFADADLALTLDDLRRWRLDAQPAVVLAYQEMRLWQFDLRIELLAERVRWRGASREPDFATAARQMLRPIVDEFHEACQADFADTTALHQLRICGKQLRYAMELLAGAFPKEFRKELYPTAGKMQDKLGSVNDHASACARLTGWLSVCDDPAKAAVYRELADHEAEAIEISADEFRSWWTPEWADRFESQLREMIDTATP